jgi:cytoskeletal protein CcmA (bactofilin family)
MALKGFMARVERGLELAEEAAARPIAPAAPAPRTVSPSTSVDAASEFEGRLRCASLRVDGCIRGEVECEKAVLIGEPARVFANISADEVQIAGTVQGDITARRKITLARTAVVTGDLTTPGIVIEEGAKLKGRIVIGSDAEPAKDAKKAQPAKKPAAAGAQPGEAASPQPLAAASA